VKYESEMDLLAAPWLLVTPLSGATPSLTQQPFFRCAQRALSSAARALRKVLRLISPLISGRPETIRGPEVGFEEISI
jgi:hypothetical protein